MIDQAAAPARREAHWLRALAEGAAQPDHGSFWRWLDDALNPSSATPRQAAGVELRGFTSRRGACSYVLKNGQAGTYLRLTPEEHFVWQRLDGRPVRQILSDYLVEYGRLASGRLFELLERLRASSMLAERPRPLYASLDERLDRRRWTRLAGRALSAALYVERPLPGADRLASAVYRAGGWLLFTRPAPVLLALVAVAGLIAYGVVLGQGGFEVMTSSGSFALGFLVFALANTLASLVAEAARAIATLHHGREVRAGGLRMLLATPTFYADTRDILLEDRRARMAVAAAGPSALIVTSGLAALVLLLVQPVDPLRDVLFKFALLGYGTALFYINPLIELDGYVLLSEWLEQPDLRERSLQFVRAGLLPKLRSRETLNRQERGLAIFGVLAAIWAAYTAAGAVYLFGWRILAGLEELWRHENLVIRNASIVAAIVAGTGLAVVSALAFVNLLTAAYRWIERRGLLAGGGLLASVGVVVATLVAVLVALAPDSSIVRGLVAPPLLIVVLLYSRRLAIDYEGALPRWFFTALALYAGLMFVGEEIAALHAFVGLDPAWAGIVDRSVSLIGPGVCLPFGLWLGSLLTSRYRASVGLLAVGVGLYAAHTFVPQGRIAAGLASLAVGLLASGVLVYFVLRRRRAASRPWQAPPASDDAARLTDGLAMMVGSVLDDVVAQSGRRVALQVERRLNQTALEAGWGIELEGMRLARARQRDLLTAAPVYRQALGQLLDDATGRIGRPFVEGSVARARDALPWDRREVFDAWVLAQLPGSQRLVERAEPTSGAVEHERLLAAIPLFGDLTQAELADLAGRLEELELPAEQPVVRQGEPGDAFYLVRSGRLVVTVETAAAEQSGDEELAAQSAAVGDSRVTQLATLGPGEYFGEMALLLDLPRTATVTTIEPTRLFMLRKEHFDTLLRRHAGAERALRLVASRRRHDQRWRVRRQDAP